MKKKKWFESYFVWIIVVAAVAVYATSIKYDFVSYDDLEYVVANPHIRDISASSITEIFTTFYKSNYHPLTTLSYAVEYAFFGKTPMIYHFDNLLLHVLNALLVFLFIRKLGKNERVAAFAALAFVLHPMHAESVAWVSARKDLLFTLFFISSLLYYIRYKESGDGKRNYTISLLLFVLSLLSKSAAVTLPLILFVIDHFYTRKLNRSSMIEKAPFLLLALTGGITAIASQYGGGAIHAQEFIGIPYYQRFFIAPFAYIYYLFQLFIPVHLSVFHPFPTISGLLLPWKYYLAAVLLVVGVLLLWKYRNKLSPTLRFALLFYTFSIFLVLQLIPFGHAVVAERYTYVAYIGPFFFIGEVLLGEKSRTGRFRLWAILLPAAVLISLSVLTFDRLHVWNNSMSLFNDIIDKYPEDTHGYMFRGNQYQEIGADEMAMGDYNRAIALDSANYMALHNRAVLRFNKGEFDAALSDLNKAITFESRYAPAYKSRASIKNRKGDWQGAVDDYNKLLELEPDNGEAYFLRASMRFKLKDKEGCCEDLHKSESLGYTYASYLIDDKCGDRGSEVDALK